MERHRALLQMRYQIVKITEMAMPRAIDYGKTYYHGTEDDKDGKSILRIGINPPDLTLKKKSMLTPVTGKVYITPTLRYAIIYCIGGDMLGHKVLDSWLTQGRRFGWLFVIDGKELKDIQPDEDSVGEMIYNKKPPWLYKLAIKHLTPKKLALVMKGEYSAWAWAGRKLLKIMDDKQKLELIDKGAHIAHTGKIKIKQAWRFDKEKSQELKDNGSNFFKLAKRVK